MIGRSKKRKRKCQISRLVTAMVLQSALAAFAVGSPQSGRPDDPKAPVRSVRAVRNKSPKPKPKEAPSASILIKVEPVDSIVTLDNERLSPDPTSGTLTLTDLNAGLHIVVARREGYREKSLTIDLTPGANEPVELTLEKPAAILNVSPALDEAQIDVRRAGAKVSSERRTGSIRNLALTPGEYDVTVSKDEYQTEKRTIILEPGQVVYLEPILTHLAPVQGTSTLSRPTVAAIPPSSFVTIEGKDLLITLVSASGNSAVNAGTVNVAATRASNVAEISGSLSGFPCRIEFVRLENVAAGSVAEAPGPSNQWSRVVIRIRPKDMKHTVRFNINWTLFLAARSPGDNTKTPLAVFIHGLVRLMSPEPLSPTASVFGEKNGVNCSGDSRCSYRTAELASEMTNYGLRINALSVFPAAHA